MSEQNTDGQQQTQKGKLRRPPVEIYSRTLPYYIPEDVAKIEGVSLDQVYQWLLDDQIFPATRIGKNRFWVISKGYVITAYRPPKKSKKPKKPVRVGVRGRPPGVKDAKPRHRRWRRRPVDEE